MRKRRHRGRRPDLPHLGEINGWLVFFRHVPDGWSTIKLVSPKRAQGKANYWLGWRDGELTGRDFADLVAHRPALAEAIVALAGVL